MSLTLLSIFSFCVFFACFLLALIVFFYGNQKVHRLWSLFNLANAIWGLSLFFIGLKFLKFHQAVLWWKIGHIAAMFISVAFLHTVLELCSIRRRTVLYIFYFLDSIYFIVLNVLGKMGYELEYMFNSFYYAKATGVPYVVATFLWFTAIFYGFFLLVKAYFKTTGLRKNQILYLLIPIFIAFLGGCSHFFPVFGIKIYPFNIIMVVYPAIATYAILKHHLLDIRVAITRAGIFLILYSFVLGVPFHLGYQTRSWILSTTFAVVLATLGPIIYRGLQVKAEQILLAQQRHYQKILLQAAGGMVREHDINRLLKLIAYIVKKSVKIRYAAIFSYDKEKKTFPLKAIRGHKIPVNTEVSFDEGARLITFMRHHPKPFTALELSSSFNARITEKLGTGFDIIVPSMIEERILGFLILGEKLDRTVYSIDDINVFQILSHQAALAIENCVFFQEFKNVQTKIFEAEKLASIGGMADGLAHQIKNRLNHFSIATGELKMEMEAFFSEHSDLLQNDEYKKTFDYIIQIADSLLTNVKRTDNVIRGILNYARTSEKDTFFDHFSIREVIKLSLELLEVKHQTKDFPLEAEFDHVDIIFGVKSQIMEAVYNILDNAYEAIQERVCFLSEEEKESFKPRITFSAKESFANTTLIVSDNGIGIKEPDQLKIFAPFFTTKSSYKPLMPKSKSGTGIGMYVVRRLIEENHQGKIWFESEYMKGTTFFMELPKKKSNK